MLTLYSSAVYDRALPWRARRPGWDIVSGVWFNAPRRQTALLMALHDTIPTSEKSTLLSACRMSIYVFHVLMPLNRLLSISMCQSALSSSYRARCHFLHLQCVVAPSSLSHSRPLASLT
jgi:hypothetical protein